MKRLIAGLIALGGLALLALAGLTVFETSGPATASHAGGMDAMSIDMDPGATPANTATSIGTRETCARINENNFLDADEDVDADKLSVDVTADTIPASNPMTAYAYKLSYPSPDIRVTGQTLGLIGTAGGSAPINTSDGVPDADGTFNSTVVDTGPTPGSSETGSGYLDRLTLETVPDVTPGVYPLTLSSAAHVDTVAAAQVPDAINNAVVAIDTHCPAEDFAPVRGTGLTSTLRNSGRRHELQQRSDVHAGQRHDRRRGHAGRAESGWRSRPGRRGGHPGLGQEPWRLQRRLFAIHTY
jgi:hypothetical protein